MGCAMSSVPMAQLLLAPHEQLWHEPPQPHAAMSAVAKSLPASGPVAALYLHNHVSVVSVVHCRQATHHRAGAHRALNQIFHMH